MPANGLKNSSAKKNMSLPLRWVPSLYLMEGLPNAVVVTLAVIILKDMGIDMAGEFNRRLMSNF